jgi:membrane protease YdiL (CAAX protease family)
MTDLLPESPPSSPVISWTWRQVLFTSATAILVLALGVAGSYVVAAAIYPPRSQAFELLFTIGALASEFVGLLLAVFVWGIVLKRSSWTAFGMRPTRWVWLLVALVLWAASRPVIVLLTLPMMALLNVKENPQLAAIVPGGFTWVGFIGMTLLGGFAVPVAEELFFRGVLYRRLRQTRGVWFSIFASAVIFGAVHGELVVIPGAIALGMILAWLYERSQSLWPGIAFHIVNNATAIILAYILAAAGAQF